MEKQGWEESERRRKGMRRSEKRKREKKMQVRERVVKSRFIVFFKWFVALEGRRVGSLKRRMRSHLARWEMKSCTPFWREAHFGSQNVQSSSVSEHFWKLQCRKSARHCGAKHISKSKCTKHLSSGALSEVEISKKCTPLWRGVHFQVKMCKPILGPFLEVEMSKECTPLWRDAHSQVKCAKHTILGSLLEVEMSKKCTPLWREANFQVKMFEKNTTWWTTFDAADVVLCRRRKELHTLSRACKTWGFCTNFNSATIDYTPLHFIQLH